MERFTAVFERGEQGWWVATCPEIPGAVSQGKTIDEAREMLRDAIELLLEVRREKEGRSMPGGKWSGNRWFFETPPVAAAPEEARLQPAEGGLQPLDLPER